MSSQPVEVSVVCAGVVVADHLCTPIDHVPSAGELVMADELPVNIGGCAANAGMVLAKLGVRAAVCGKVGNDIFGRFVRETLEQAGVESSYVAVDFQHATSQSLIINVQGQDRRFIHSFGANRSLTVADIDNALLANPRILYVGGFLILPSLDATALAERFALARKRGIITMLDVATPGPADYLRHLKPILPETDIFLPNTDEASLILGLSDAVDQALAFRDFGAKHVVITRGEHGAVVLSDDLRVKLGTYPVHYVDGTGGGDSFDAGYIAGLLDGKSELDCLRFASAIGASCVRKVGTTAGIFTREEASEFMDKHELPIETF